MDNALGLGVVDGVYQVLKARLDLFDESIVMTKFREGEATSCFEVGAVELASAFSGIPISTGLLPRECLFYSRVGGGECLGVFVPPDSWSLTVADVGVFDVPLPPLVWAGHRRGYQVWAVKQRPGKRERLFSAPFPNVYGDGKVCAGNVKFPICTARTIHEAFELFIRSEFNEHLAGNKSERHPDSVLTLWEELHDEVDFPLEDLVKTKSVLADVVGGA